MQPQAELQKASTTLHLPNQPLPLRQPTPFLSALPVTNPQVLAMPTTTVTKFKPQLLT
jgi:hypothetical protein